MLLVMIIDGELFSSVVEGGRRVKVLYVLIDSFSLIALHDLYPLILRLDRSFSRAD